MNKIIFSGATFLSYQKLIISSGKMEKFTIRFNHQLGIIQQANGLSPPVTFLQYIIETILSEFNSYNCKAPNNHFSNSIKNKLRIHKDTLNPNE